MMVSLNFVGEPIGVKEGGGVLDQQFREIKILCEPANIPDSIDIDVSNMDLNDSIHISDIKVGKGLEIHENPEALVAAIVVVRQVEEVTEETPTEPEIVGSETTEE